MNINLEMLEYLNRQNWKSSVYDARNKNENTILCFMEETTWKQVETALAEDKGKDYLVDKYMHRFRQMYAELLSTPPAEGNPNWVLEMDDVGWGYNVTIWDNEKKEYEDMEFVPWESLLSVPIKEESMQKLSKERMLVLFLKRISTYGWTKISSDTNIEWHLKEKENEKKETA